MYIAGMQHIPDHNQPVDIAPLHAILFAWGRRLWTAPVATPKFVVSNVRDEGSLTQQMQKITVQQLATSLRMHGIEGEDDTLLSSLESMALAGEMTFEEFATRVKNLYPKTFEHLDVTLRMKIAAMIVAQAN